MIKEEKINFTAKWCKYSKYKIVDRDDKLYILPDENSKPSTYDPFEFSNELLKEMLTIGKEVAENKTININSNALKYEILSKDEYFQKLVLKFVNKYGLLGMFKFWPDSYEFITNPELSVSTGRGRYVSAKEFWQRYFCFETTIDWAGELPYCIDFSYLTGLNDFMKQTEGDRLDDIVFARNYAETVSEILDLAELIYENKKLINAYFYDEVSEDVKEMYAQSINYQTINNVSLGYYIDGNQVKFEWRFNSLASIIKTMLLVNETNGRNEVKLCKYCGTPFVANNIKAEYDTPQCRNKANIYKSRNKNK